MDNKHMNTSSPDTTLSLTECVSSAEASRRLAHKRSRHLKERLVEFILFLAAFSSVATTFAIVAILVYESIPLFKHVSLVEFLTDPQWTPLFDDAHFGIMPLVSGTLVTTGVALSVCIPMGIQTDRATPVVTRVPETSGMMPKWASSNSGVHWGSVRNSTSETCLKSGIDS